MLHARTLAAALLGAALALYSLSSLPSSARAEEAAATRPAVTTLTGKLVCVGCHLEKAHGAQAQCTLHAKHAQGFLADDGKLYTLLDNERGHLLITNRKLADAPLRLEARVFPQTQVVEVVRYALEKTGSWVQHDYCKQCGFEPGDNGGKDLCGDCAK